VREAEARLDLLHHHRRPAAAQVELEQHEVGGVSVVVDGVRHTPDL
jgi:hypothetical protein